MATRRLTLLLILGLVVALLPRPIIAQDYIVELAKFDASLKVADTAISAVQHNVYDTHLPDGTDALEWELILTAPPPTNTFTFPIETKALVFYYQPPLDEELNPAEFDTLNATHAISKNFTYYRPPNVVGSYAVYHASKRDNVYTTGKLWHIYRPFLIDAKLQTSGANLTITRDFLTITMDAKFLETAAYPIVVDPSFGKTDIGASSGTGANFMWASMYQTGSDADGATLDSLSVALNNVGGTDTLKIGIYNATGELTSPAGEDYLWGSDAFDPTVEDGWNTVDISSGNPTLYASTWYALTMRAVAADPDIYYDSGSSGSHYYKSYSYTEPWPDPWPSSPTAGSNKYSIFGNYTLAAGVERFFTLLATLRLHAAALPTFEVRTPVEHAFNLYAAIHLHDAEAIAKELGYLATGTIRLWDSAAATTEGVAQDLTFLLTETLHLIATVAATMETAALVLDAASIAGLALIIALVAVALIMVRRRND